MSDDRARQADLLVRLRVCVENLSELVGADDSEIAGYCETALALVADLADACGLSEADIDAAEDRIFEG